MPSVNLAPGTQYAIAARHRRQRLFWLALVIFVILALIWVGMLLYRKQVEGELSDTRDQLSTVQSELARLNDEAQRVEAFEKQLSSLSQLMQEHVVWEPLFQGIERLLPAPVRLTNLEAKGETGELFLTGRTPDVDQLSQALASLETESSPFDVGQLTQVTRVETPAGEGEPALVDYVFEAELTFDRNLITP
ncbi:MAG: hypothetical protein HYZ61_01730 [Candidatus Andersenbacteria bacterium]|nr:hypothetical protein [Candidatus Andersenbacteria bacterium]